jgi:hypothetical protein
MKTVAVILNIVLLGFTCLVLATDGLPKEATYIVHTIWIFLTLILSAAVISRGAVSHAMRTAAIVSNIVLLGFICWSLVDQYPHPKEAGFIPFVVLSLFTPGLNLFVLFHGGARDARPTKIA